MIGIPKLRKNSSVLLEIGAAEVTATRQRDRPRRSRTVVNTSLSATPYNNGRASPVWSAYPPLSPCLRAHAAIFFCRPEELDAEAAWIFA